MSTMSVSWVLIVSDWFHLLDVHYFGLHLRHGLQNYPLWFCITWYESFEMLEAHFFICRAGETNKESLEAMVSACNGWFCVEFVMNYLQRVVVCKHVRIFHLWCMSGEERGTRIYPMGSVSLLWTVQIYQSGLNTFLAYLIYVFFKSPIRCHRIEYLVPFKSFPA